MKSEKLTAILQGAKFKRLNMPTYFYKVHKDGFFTSVASHFVGTGNVYRHEGFINMEASLNEDILYISSSIMGKRAEVVISLNDLELC